MGIEGSIVGGSAGGVPVSMELLQLIAADPVEFQRRMALLEQSKKDFDEQLEKNQIVADILALRKEAVDAVNAANATKVNSEAAAAKLLAEAKTQSEKLLEDAQVKASSILDEAIDAATEEKKLAATILSQAQAEADAVKAREAEAEATMKDAEAKYQAVEPDRKKFQADALAAQAAAVEADKAKAAYEAKYDELDAVAKQIAKVLGGN